MANNRVNRSARSEFLIVPRVPRAVTRALAVSYVKTIKEEIQKAIQRLGLNDSQIMLLPEEEGRRAFNAALSHFVASGDRRWWEDFRFPSTSFRSVNGAGFGYIEKIVPDKREKIWFVAEDYRLWT